MFEHTTNSPDLNPIELVWVNLKQSVEERESYNKKELKAEILIAWEKLSNIFIQNCIKGLKGQISY